MTNVRLTLAAVVIASTSLCSFGADVTFGVQGTISAPLSDLKAMTASETGYGAGLFADLQFAGGRTLRPRVDFIKYPGVTWSPAGWPQDYRQWSNSSIGLEYLHHPSGTSRGVYFSVGVAENHFYLKMTFNGVPDSSGVSHLGFSVGVGFSGSTRFEPTLRYTETDIDGVKLAALNAGFAFRF